MPAVNYMMITVASVETDRIQGVLQKVGHLAQELKDQAGATSTRYGVITTGDYAGKLILFQGYEDLSGIDRAFQLYGKSDTYRAIVTTPTMKIVLRNIWKLEQIGLPDTSATPAYGVVTRFEFPDPMVEQMREMLPVFQKNGAMVFRYGTLMTGSHAGRRLVGVGYPSMDSIEQTYRALRTSDAYKRFMNAVELDFRNVIRFEG